MVLGEVLNTFSHEEPRFDRASKWYYDVYAEMICGTDDERMIVAMLLSIRYFGFFAGVA